MNNEIKRRLRHGNFVIEEREDGQYHIAGINGDFGTLEEAMDYIDTKLSGTDLIEAREAGAKAFASGMEMEEAQEALDRIKANYHL